MTNQNGNLWNSQETHRRTGKGKQRQKIADVTVNNKIADLNANFIKYKLYTNQNKKVTKYIFWL